MDLRLTQTLLLIPSDTDTKGYSGGGGSAWGVPGGNLTCNLTVDLLTVDNLAADVLTWHLSGRRKKWVQFTLLKVIQKFHQNKSDKNNVPINCDSFTLLTNWIEQKHSKTTAENIAQKRNSFIDRKILYEKC